MVYLSRVTWYVIVLVWCKFVTNADRRQSPKFSGFVKSEFMSSSCPRPVFGQGSWGNPTCSRLQASCFHVTLVVLRSVELLWCSCAALAQGWKVWCAYVLGTVVPSRVHPKPAHWAKTLWGGASYPHSTGAGLKAHEVFQLTLCFEKVSSLQNNREFKETRLDQ